MSDPCAWKHCFHVQMAHSLRAQNYSDELSPRRLRILHIAEIVIPQTCIEKRHQLRNNNNNKFIYLLRALSQRLVDSEAQTAAGTGGKLSALISGDCRSSLS
jgi:hypothetical protein